MSQVGTLLGRVVAGKFMIEERVGGGAMGEVFRARHVVLDTVIAVKILHADIANDPMFKERFYREAKAASRLDHPNSVRVLDFGVESDGLVYLAMEFLHGRDLLSVVREEWPLPDERIVDIVVQALAAISVAHELGIVHRDLKPENIMVHVGADDDGTRPYHVKVCDFGIAKLTSSPGMKSEGRAAITSRGMLIGTPEYMSPEQARGDPLDARSDLYSLGVVLYQLLVGRVPFTAENAIGVALKQITDEVPAPSTLRAGVNPRLEAICLRALAKAREDRYQSAKDMRRDLRGVFGYAGAKRHDESGGHPLAEDSRRLELSNAPTLAHSDPPPEPIAPGTDPDFSPKDTSQGTELTVPITGTHRYVTVLVALVALAIGAVVVSFVFFGKAREVAVGADAAAVVGSSAPAGESAGTPTTLPPVTAPETPAKKTTKVGVVGSVVPVPRPSTGASTSTSSSTSTSTTPTPTPTTTTTPTTSTTVPVASGPPYNPAGAHVALGNLTVERVRADVIGRKMSDAVPKLSECYRTALMMAGAPVAGSAEIHMSIDETGSIRSAFVNAPKHPQFARCAQQTLTGLSVPVSALEDAKAGATAAQWLTLHP